MRLSSYIALAFCVLGFFTATGIAAWMFVGVTVLTIISILYSPKQRSLMRRVVNSNPALHENRHYWSVIVEEEEEGGVCFLLLTDDQLRDAMSRAGKQSEDVYVTAEEVSG